MATKVRNTAKIFHAPALPNPPAEYNVQWQNQHNAVLRYYFANLDDAISRALQFDTSDIIDGSIPNSKLENSTVSFGGVTLALGESDATPAFNLSDATGYPTSSLVGTITNAQLAGSIENSKLVNDSVSYGGVSLDLGQSDATPAFDLSDATNYPTSSLSGTIATAQIADLAVTSAKLASAAVTFGKIGTAAVGATAIQPSAVTTNKIADDAVTSAKITGPFSSKYAFGTTGTQSISTTSATTIYEPDIPAPPGGNEATQSINAVVRVRFYNSSSSSIKENHQWNIKVAIKSKTNVGTSLGTATFLFSPSTYNAWYYVSGDKTSIFASNRGGIATSSTGANLGAFVGVYYDAANDRTVFRVSKFPDATTIYNGVEVFYSTVNFASSGTFVNDLGFNNQYLTIGSTTAYQTIELPLVFSFGKSTTATEVRIQFDHVSSITNLSTVITSISGYVENIV